MKTLTEAQARKLGYRLERGAYSGTTDDRMDRWYWDDMKSEVVDRRGGGYFTKKDALEALTRHLALEAISSDESLRELFEVE